MLVSIFWFTLYTYYLGWRCFPGVRERNAHLELKVNKAIQVIHALNSKQIKLHLFPGVYVYICPSVSLSISNRLFIYFKVFKKKYLFVCLFICYFLFLFIYLFIYLLFIFICLFTFFLCLLLPSFFFFFFVFLSLSISFFIFKSYNLWKSHSNLYWLFDL